jgi:hypothetical protein
MRLGQSLPCGKWRRAPHRGAESSACLPFAARGRHASAPWGLSPGLIHASSLERVGLPSSPIPYTAGKPNVLNLFWTRALF